MKKKLVFLISVLIILAFAISGTLAYFTDEVVAHNVITTGNVALQVSLDGSDEAIPVMPGSKVERPLEIIATEGTAQAFIRVKYDVVFLDAAGEIMPHTPEEIDAVLLIDEDTANWTEKDGWWYYGGTIGDGEKTGPLYREIAFSGENMDNDYQGCTIRVTVTAQGVQKANNGDSALEAAGWPEVSAN